MSAPDAEGFGGEAFAATLAEQMEQNARMIDAFDDVAAAVPELRGQVEGFQRSLREENRRLKTFVRLLPVDVPEEQRAENWDDIETV